MPRKGSEMQLPSGREKTYSSMPCGGEGRNAKKNETSIRCSTARDSTSFTEEDRVRDTGLGEENNWGY